jgi:hypothetical protein
MTQIRHPATLPFDTTSESKTLECRVSRSMIYSTPRKSWQALPTGIDKPLAFRASTSPLPPGLRRALRLPLSACQIATAETRFLLVYLARKGIAPCRPTRPQAHLIPRPELLEPGDYNTATSRWGRSMSPNPTALRWGYDGVQLPRVHKHTHPWTTAANASSCASSPLTTFLRDSPFSI